MDVRLFSSVAVAGIPLLFVVIGLVTWIGDLGVTGRGKLIASMMIGLVLGAGYQISQSMPVDFAGWFAVIVYGLALGIVASKVYDTGRALIEQGFRLGRLPLIEDNEPETPASFLRRAEPPVK